MGMKRTGASLVLTGWAAFSAIEVGNSLQEAVHATGHESYGLRAQIGYIATNQLRYLDAVNDRKDGVPNPDVQRKPVIVDGVERHPETFSKPITGIWHTTAWVVSTALAAYAQIPLGNYKPRG